MTAPAAALNITASVLPKLASLPIINIAPYLRAGDTTGRLSTSAALHAACLEYGFFYLDISQYVDPGEAAELANSLMTRWTICRRLASLFWKSFEMPKKSVVASFVGNLSPV